MSDQRSTDPDMPATSAATAPALTGHRWSGRKTAVAAALAIGLSGTTGVVAAQAVPAGSVSDGGNDRMDHSRSGSHQPPDDQPDSDDQADSDIGP